MAQMTRPIKVQYLGQVSKHLGSSRVGCVRWRGPTYSEKGWEEQTAKHDGARAWEAVGDLNVAFGDGIWTVADLDGVVQPSCHFKGATKNIPVLGWCRD